MKTLGSMKMLKRWSGRSAQRSAFTMIGNIGALAVIAILVGVIAPSVIKRVDHATWTKETTDLQTIADSYTQYILTNKTIPGPNTWATSVANYMSLPVSKITTNSRRFARVFLVDTNLTINGNGLPYTQTTNGTPTKPVSARVIFVSSLARALPTNIVTGAALSTNEFNAIWDTPEGAKPSTWTPWAGSGDDLRIKRLTLEPLFYQLILVDRDTANPAFFSIDSTNLIAVPTASSPPGWNRYYLDGTILGLHAANGTVQSRYLLKRSFSIVFESGAWTAIPSTPAYSGTGSDFVNHALTFFNSRTNPYPQAVGSSQESVINAMYTFMFDYSLWANECPHFSDHGNGGSPASVPEYMLLDNQGANGGTVNTFSLNLDKTP